MNDINPDTGELKTTITLTARLPRIPEGEYEAEYVGEEVKPYMGDPRSLKLHVHFKITSPGPGQGVILTRYYNIQRGPDGKLSAGQRSAYFRELCNVADTSAGDDISPDAFRGKRILVRVCDVLSDSNGEFRQGGAVHSKIEAVLGVRDSQLDDITSPSFQAFWNLWPPHPRKWAKAECWRLWREGGFDAVAGDIHQHVRAMSASAQWKAQRGKYIPAPYSYLRDRRWEGAALPEPMTRRNVI